MGLHGSTASCSAAHLDLRTQLFGLHTRDGYSRCLVPLLSHAYSIVPQPDSRLRTGAMRWMPEGPAGSRRGMAWPTAAVGEAQAQNGSCHSGNGRWPQADTTHLALLLAELQRQLLEPILQCTYAIRRIRNAHDDKRRSISHRMRLPNDAKQDIDSFAHSPSG